MGNRYFLYQNTSRDFIFINHQRLYDNSIVAYQTGTGQNNQLVLNTIRKAKRKEGVTAKLQLHSDQGFQYTSHGYFKLTQAYGITPSMSRKGNPYDNAPAENFFSILKNRMHLQNKNLAVLKKHAVSLMNTYIFTIIKGSRQEQN